MHEQVGWRGFVERLKEELPGYTHIFPQLPRLAHRALQQHALGRPQDSDVLKLLVLEQRRTNRLLTFLAVAVGVTVAGIGALLLM